MVPKKIVLNVSSDSTSWQIALAKSLPFLLSHLALHSRRYASEDRKTCPLSLSEMTHSDVLLVTELPRNATTPTQFCQGIVKVTSCGRYI